MYQLLVFHPNQTRPEAVVGVGSAAEVLTTISRVIAEHEGCEHVVVMGPNGVRLFSVDCQGNRLP